MAESQSVSIRRKTGVCDNFAQRAFTPESTPPPNAQATVSSGPPGHQVFAESQQKLRRSRGEPGRAAEWPPRGKAVPSEALGPRTAAFPAGSPGKAFPTSPDTHQGPTGDSRRGWAVTGQRRLPETPTPDAFVSGFSSTGGPEKAWTPHALHVSCLPETRWAPGPGVEVLPGAGRPPPGPAPTSRSSKRGAGGVPSSLLLLTCRDGQGTRHGSWLRAPCKVVPAL